MVNISCLLQVEDQGQSGPDYCPRIERVRGSRLIPVGMERELDLIGRNLNLLNVSWLSSDQEGKLVQKKYRHLYRSFT